MKNKFKIIDAASGEKIKLGEGQMNVKEQWLDSFQELLWGHHTCDWDAGNRKPDYPYQLAVAYFDWEDDGTPTCLEAAFNRYLENQDE